MAVISFNFDRYGNTAGRPADPETTVAAIDTAIDAVQAGDLASLTTAMAVLQADGATPTEAHVDTADTALIAMTAALAAVQTTQTAAAVIAVNVPTAGVQVSIDTSISKNDAIKALEAALVEVRRTTELS